MELKAKRCKAKSKSTQAPCKNLAILGGEVCGVHGGRAPQVKRKARVRVALAEAIQDGERRTSEEILSDAQHTADVLMQDAVVKLGEGGEVTVEQLRILQDALERAGRWAKVAIDADVQERIAQHYVERAKQQRQAFLWILLRTLASLNLLDLSQDSYRRNGENPEATIQIALDFQIEAYQQYEETGEEPELVKMIDWLASVRIPGDKLTRYMPWTP